PGRSVDERTAIPLGRSRCWVASLLAPSGTGRCTAAPKRSYAASVRAAPRCPGLIRRCPVHATHAIASAVTTSGTASQNRIFTPDSLRVADGYGSPTDTGRRQRRVGFCCRVADAWLNPAMTISYADAVALDAADELR